MNTPRENGSDSGYGTDGDRSAGREQGVSMHAYLFDPARLGFALGREEGPHSRGKSDLFPVDGNATSRCHSSVPTGHCPLTATFISRFSRYRHRAGTATPSSLNRRRLTRHDYQTMAGRDFLACGRPTYLPTGLVSNHCDGDAIVRAAHCPKRGALDSPRRKPARQRGAAKRM